MEDSGIESDGFRTQAGGLGIVCSGGRSENVKKGSDVSHLSAMYYTSAVLLVLSAYSAH